MIVDYVPVIHPLQIQLFPEIQQWPSASGSTSGAIFSSSSVVACAANLVLCLGLGLGHPLGLVSRIENGPRRLVLRIGGVRLRLVLRIGGVRLRVVLGIESVRLCLLIEQH